MCGIVCLFSVHKTFTYNIIGNYDVVSSSYHNYSHHDAHDDHCSVRIGDDVCKYNETKLGRVWFDSRSPLKNEGNT